MLLILAEEPDLRYPQENPKYDLDNGDDNCVVTMGHGRETQLLLVRLGAFKLVSNDTRPS